jgi:hypothetical protein
MSVREAVSATATAVLWLVATPSAAGVQERQVSARFQFFCNTGYSVETCRAHLGRLQEVLARFDLRKLGDWSWILVRSEDWKPILLSVRRDPDSPAFTILEKRQTFLEEALFVRIAGRDRTLLERWRIRLDELLEYAVTHELGHALCREPDEARAHDYARELRRSGAITCAANPHRVPAVPAPRP